MNRGTILLGAAVIVGAARQLSLAETGKLVQQHVAALLKTALPAS